VDLYAVQVLHVGLNLSYLQVACLCICRNRVLLPGMLQQVRHMPLMNGTQQTELERSAAPDYDQLLLRCRIAFCQAPQPLPVHVQACC
jgi:hypothetical protein